MKHIIDKVCSCEICEKLDIMYGDPKLSKWERKFVISVGEQGWLRNYSKKQIRKTRQIFEKQRARYSREN